MSRHHFYFVLILLLLSAATAGIGCDDLEEQEEETDIGDGDEAEYPFYLVIGGGLSETLSVLRIEEGPSFELFNDVVLTGSAINQTLWHDDSFYAVCSLSHSVIIYNGDLDIRREVSVGVGSNPMNAALSEDDTAWISGMVSGDVRLVDLGAGVDEDDRLLATVEFSDDLLPHDEGTDQTWPRPNGVVLRDQWLWVVLSNLEDNWLAGGPGVLAVVDTDDESVDGAVTLQGRDPIGVLWDEERNLLWVVSAGDYVTGEGFAGNGLLEAVDIEEREVVQTIEVEGAPFELLIADSSLGYLVNGQDGRLLVVDLDEGEQLDSIDLRDDDDTYGLSFISALAVDPEGLLYVAEFNNDKLFVIDPAQNHDVIAEFVVNDGPDTLTFIP